MALGRPRKYSNDFHYTRRINWYLSRGWRERIRPAALKRAKRRCERCGAKPKRLEVHHKIDPFPARDVDLLTDPANLEVLCAKCHRIEHHDMGASTKCEVCGDVVKHNPYQSGKRRFCSLACRDKHPDFAALPNRLCDICEEEFHPTQKNQRMCGAECANESTARKKFARRPRFICPTCGDEFSMPKSQADRPRKSGPFCSRECRFA